MKNKIKYEDLSNMYITLKLIENLEILKPKLITGDYHKKMTSFLNRFKNLQNIVNINIEKFCKDYSLNFDMINTRLKGIKNTIKTHIVAKTTESYITLMDGLNLNLQKDDIIDLTKNLCDLLDNFKNLNFKNKNKPLEWLKVLKENLTEKQIRQFLFDIDTSYNEFINCLNLF